MHLIGYEDIAPDPKLDAALARLRPELPTWIFTASTSEHVARCVDALQLRSLQAASRGTIDTRTCKLETKHSPASFAAAMAAAAQTEPSGCVLCDDSVKNIKAAKAAGWQTVLVGMTDRDSGEKIVCAEADFHLPSLHALPEAMPELFVDA